jgi:hypothetical protein
MVYFSGVVREHRARFFGGKFGPEFGVKNVAVGAQHAAPLQLTRTNRLGGGGAGDAVFEEGDELSGIGRRRQAGLAGADYG